MGVALNADWRARTQVGGCSRPPMAVPALCSLHPLLAP